jgi:phage tail sheath protein FI
MSDTLGGTKALTVTAISEGTWGASLRVVVDTNVRITGEFNLNVLRYQTQGGVSTIAQQEVFRNLSMDKAKANFVEAIVNDPNSGSNLVRVAINPGNPKAPMANGTVSGAIANPAMIVIPANPTVTVTIGSTLNLVCPLKTVAGTFTLTELAPILEAAIRAVLPGNTEFAGATVEIVNANHVRVLAGSGNPSDLVTFSGGVAPDFALQSGTATPNVQQYTLGTVAAVSGTAQLTGTAGLDGVPPNGADLIGSLAAKTGIYALEDVDLFNLLCIPRTAITSGANALGPAEAASVITVAEQYCESRRAFFLMDTPLGVTKPVSIKGYLAANDNLRDKNAALYYPRVQVADPLNSFRLRSFGASGTIAGLCARTDSARGVWKSPAGTEATLTNVSQLDYALTDSENGILNPLGINCLRNFAVYGNICWGARTLEGADQLESEWKYVPVRRFTLYLEESLYRGVKWVVFEPNDEPLWSQIRLNIGAFLQNLFRQGAFQGTSSRDAYFVKCDSETTTQNDIDNGVVNIVVGFAPLKPAEFVILKIQQIAGQIPT